MVLHAFARLPHEWREALARHGERPFHADQIFRWLHQRGVTDPTQMTDLSRGLRERLALEGVAAPVTVTRVKRSADGTRKLLVDLPDQATIETVLLPMSGPAADDADVAAADTEDDDDGGEPPAGRGRRVTQCVSTQVGCAMGCVFCASGLAGLERHLTAAEIVGQVTAARGVLAADERLRNVVFMGMGEPLHNYDETARAIRVLSHPNGLALPLRRITVSTSGLVPQIRQLGDDFGGRVSLAISLHSATDASRSALMPINKRYPLSELMAAVRDYPLPRRRRITIEYTLVRGKNDTETEARAVARLLRGLRVKVNLIPMNPIGGSSLGPTAGDGVAGFQRVLQSAGLLCFVRRRRGDDVDAACGQLALLDPRRPRRGSSRGAS